MSGKLAPGHALSKSNLPQYLGALKYYVSLSIYKKTIEIKSIDASN